MQISDEGVFVVSGPVVVSRNDYRCVEGQVVQPFSNNFFTCDADL